MKKRIRRKKHLGEFRQMGFSVKFNLLIDVSEIGMFIGDFVERAVEKNGLCFSGHGSREWNGVVERNHRFDSTTDEDVRKITSWLEERPEVESLSVSDFWDVWHGSDPFEK